MTSSEGKHLFRFGFSAPAEWSADQEQGWHGESSDAFWVLASTPERAEIWGRVVADRLVNALFRSAGVAAPPWVDSEFASWVEAAPLDEFSEEQLADLDVVPDGHFPEQNWLLDD